mgnify:FL=1
MGMILFSCLLDSIILFWYNKKNNKSPLVFKFLTCCLILFLLTIILNRFEFSTFIYRLFPVFLIYTLLLFIISKKRKLKEVLLRTTFLMFSIMFSELSTSIIIMIGAGSTKLENLLKNFLFGIISLFISRVVEVLTLHLISIFPQPNRIKENIKWHLLSIGVVLAYLYTVVYCFIKGKIK